MKEKYTPAKSTKNKWNYAALVNKNPYTQKSGSGNQSADSFLIPTEPAPLELQVPNNPAAEKPVYQSDDMQIYNGAGDTNAEGTNNLCKGAGEFSQRNDWRLIRQIRHIQENLEAETRARLQVLEEKFAEWGAITSRLQNGEDRLAQQEQQLIQHLENFESQLAKNQELNTRLQHIEQELKQLSNIISRVEVRMQKGEEGFNVLEDKLLEQVLMSVKPQVDDIKTVQQEMASRLQSANGKTEYKHIDERLQATENKISILDEWAARFEADSRKSSPDDMDNYQAIVTRLKHVEDFCNYLLALVQTDNSGRSFDFSKGLVFKG